MGILFQEELLAPHSQKLPHPVNIPTIETVLIQ